MANMGSIGIRTPAYRPCYVCGKKALFHRYVEYSMNEGKTRYTLAIVEYEDGTIDLVDPSSMCFVPGIMNEYCFE